MSNFARPIEEYVSQKRDPYWENVVLYTHLDADPPIDLSLSGHTLTGGSGFSLDESVFKFGSGSADLTGLTTNDYVDAADHADWEFGAGTWTIECWWRTPDNTSYSAMLSQWGSSPQKSWMLDHRSSTDELRFLYSEDGTAEILTLVSWIPTNDVWYHIAASRDQDGIIRVFRDGVLVSSRQTTDSFQPSTADLRIGASDTGGTSDANIDEVRITKGVCRYKEDFTVQKEEFNTSIPIFVDYTDPYWDHVVLLTDFDTKDIPRDASTRKHLLTFGAGATLITSQKKWGEASVDYSISSTSYVNAPDNADWHFSDQDFTLEGWFRWDVAAPPTSGLDVLLGQWEGTPERSFILYLDTTGLFFGWSTTGSDFIGMGSGTWDPTINVWHHISFCRNGVDGRFFVDGVQIGSTGDFTANPTFNNSTGNFRMGVPASASADSWNGQTDGVRITKGIARYITDFLPLVRAHPTIGSDQHFDAVTALAPLNDAAGSYRDRGPDDIGASSDTGVTTELTVLLNDEPTADLDTTANAKISLGDPYWDSVVLLTHLDHVTPIDVSASAHTITVNNAVRDVSIAKFGASSYDFQGNDTFNLSISDSSDFDFGSSDFTIECWVYWDAVRTTFGDVITQYDATGSDRAWRLSVSATDTLEFQWSTNGTTTTTVISPAVTITNDTWYHLTVVRRGVDIIIFWDGDEVLRGDIGSDTIHNSAADLRIGNKDDAEDSSHEGWIDDVRITKGVGRYPGSFLPPTRPHSSAQLIPTSGPFTIEGWVRFEDDPGTATNEIFASQYNSGQDERGWLFSLENNQLRFSYSTDGTVGTVVATDKAWNPATDTWYFLAITRDESDDFRWFVDGLQVGSTTNITDAFHDSSAVSFLGDQETSATKEQKYLANWRFTSGVARHVADFRRPLGPFETRAIDPRDLGSVDMWFDASAEGGLETDDLADVVTLFDLSGNGNHASNSTVSERPTVLAPSNANAINGRRVIDFDGVTQWISAAITDNRYDGEDVPNTMAGVIQVSAFPAADTTDVVCELANDTDVDPIHAFSLRDTAAVPQWRLFRRDDADALDVTVDDVTGATTTDPHSFVMVLQGTTMSLWIDGTLEQDGVAFNVGVQTIETFMVGARRAGGTEAQHADFRLGELILYDEALGDDAALILSNYLAAKWGV